MTEQITDKMYMGEPVKDNQPLTEETLQELGFEDLCGGSKYIYDTLKVKNHTLNSRILPKYLWRTENENIPQNLH